MIEQVGTVHDSVTIENPNTPPDHDDSSNIEFIAEKRISPRLALSLHRNSTTCIKSSDVALWRTESDKELNACLKSDDKYFRSEQRQRQQDEFRALLEKVKST